VGDAKEDKEEPTQGAQTLNLNAYLARHEHEMKLAVGPPESEGDKAARREAKQREDEESLRQRRWIFNVALVAVSMILVGSGVGALFLQDPETRKFAQGVFTQSVLSVVTFLFGRANSKKSD
jgi:hypothetical protein